MDFDRGSNDLAAEAVRFLIRWVHGEKLLQNPAKETAGNLIWQTFVTFVSFCSIFVPE